MDAIVEKVLNLVLNRPEIKQLKKTKRGSKGSPPAHQWDGTKIRFQRPDGSWGKWVDLRGKTGGGLKGDKGESGKTPVKGKDYFDGKNGKTPKKGVDYFDGKDGKDGYTPVKGKDYFDGAQGAQGSPPAHQWEGTKIRFQRPDGSWGKWIDLKGAPGTDGDPGLPGPPGNETEAFRKLQRDISEIKKRLS